MSQKHDTRVNVCAGNSLFLSLRRDTQAQRCCFVRYCDQAARTVPSRVQILSGVELDSVKTVETALQPLKLHHPGGVGDWLQEESEWRCESWGGARVGQQSWEWSEMDSQIQAGRQGGELRPQRALTQDRAMF